MTGPEVATRLILVLLAASASTLLPAQTAVPAAVVHAPTAIPDRIILTWDGNPATTQSVTWRTDTSVEDAWAQITLMADGPNFTGRLGTVRAVSQTAATDLGTAKYHTATFTELFPDTQYLYRVGDGVNWSSWSHFRTAAATAEPLEFLYLGDVQNDIAAHWSRLIETAYGYAPNSRLILYAGDLINTWNRDAEWGEFHRAAGWINRRVSTLPTPGNHEHGTALTPNWRPQFALPMNGIQGEEETVYYFDIQGVRFISLNVVRASLAQLEWLEKVLGQNPNRWTVVLFHYPIFSAAKGRDNPELRAALQPVFDKYNVDLVLTGHDHTYARSGVVKLDSAQNPAAGTVYITTVSGPKMYDINIQPWMLRKAEDTQLFQVLRIAGDELVYESRCASGALYDRFRLRKQSGRANVMTNEIPATVERLRSKGTNN